MSGLVMVAVPLLTLALIDGACSGFRAGLGRTGLIRHGKADQRQAVRGAALVTALLVPAVLVLVADVATDPAHGDLYLAPGRAMLAVLLPYAIAVGTALSAYAMLGWRQKYVAIALFLGPFTLIRPVVAVAAALIGVLEAASPGPVVAIVLATLTVLVVEPLESRRFNHMAAEEHAH